jgi:putative membrane protein
MMWWPDGGAGMAGWSIVMVLVLVGIAVVTVVVVLAAGTSGEPTAAEVLDERFARGEIDASEYRERKAALAEHRTA